MYRTDRQKFKMAAVVDDDFVDVIASGQRDKFKMAASVDDDFF